MNVPFERETARTHAASMLAAFLGLSVRTAGRVTDMNPGANLRTLIEAAALRLEHLDTKAFAALRRGIPEMLFEVFGEGDGLTTTVGFPRYGALPATGMARFTRLAGYVGAVPLLAGRRLAILGQGRAVRTYVTTVASELGALADTVDVPLQATTAGQSGNTPAGTLALLDGIPGIGSATNPTALINGRDEETDEARRVRFVGYLRNLARAQHGGLEAGALTAKVVSGAGVVLEQVVTARALDTAGKRGLIDLYVDNGGATASAALVAEVQQIVDGIPNQRVGYKAAGVVVTARAVVPLVVPVTVADSLDGGFRFADVQAAAAAALTATLGGIPVFEPALYVDLVQAVASTPGVRDAVFTTPTANVPTGVGRRILPGAITVTEIAT